MAILLANKSQSLTRPAEGCSDSDLTDGHTLYAEAVLTSVTMPPGTLAISVIPA